MLWEDGLLLWIYSKSSPGNTIEYYPAAVADLAQNGLQQCLQYFGRLPNKIIIPYTAQQIKILCRTVDDWAILRFGFSGEV
ncbi:hypothetical protein ACQP3J_30405, partial [Escherichia coli]